MVSLVIDKIHEKRPKAGAETAFRVGDSIKVHVKIREGDKERIQVFAGVVIAKKGHGATEMFTVRRVSHGVGVERIFPMRSPYVTKIEVESSGRVRRAKIYYLRDLAGKKTRLKPTTQKAAAKA